VRSPSSQANLVSVEVKSDIYNDRVTNYAEEVLSREQRGVAVEKGNNSIGKGKRVDRPNTTRVWFVVNNG
jgi:hypothetical protein